MIFSLRAYFGNPPPDLGEKHDMWLEASTLGGGNGGVRGGKRDMTYDGLFGNDCPVYWYRLRCVVCGDSISISLSFRRFNPTSLNEEQQRERAPQAHNPKPLVLSWKMGIHKSIAFAVQTEWRGPANGIATWPTLCIFLV